MTTDDYISLIYKNLKREISHEELVRLNKQTLADSKWATIRYEIEESWDISGDEEQLVTPSETEALVNRIIKSAQQKKEAAQTGNSMSKKGSQKVKNESTKIISLTKVLSSIAAIAVLVFGITFLMQRGDTIYDVPGEYTLADNSIITLRSGSVSVAKFSNSDRNVKLEGEAFFNIAKDAARPFRVIGRDVKIEVLGTSFLVKESGLETFIRVEEGKVSTLDTRSLDNEILTAGMTAQHLSDGKISLIGGFENLSSWKDGFYQYKNTTLGVVLSELSVIFDTEINVINSDLHDCDFSGNLAGESLKDVLNQIAKIHKIELRQIGTKWTLTGGNCN